MKRVSSLHHHHQARQEQPSLSTDQAMELLTLSFSLQLRLGDLLCCLLVLVEYSLFLEEESAVNLADSCTCNRLMINKSIRVCRYKVYIYVYDIWGRMKHTHELGPLA